MPTHDAPRVAHVIQYISRDFGGPVVGLSNLTTALSSVGCATEVYAAHRSAEGEPIELASSVCRFILQDVTWGSLRHSSNLWRALGNTSCSLIHSHGLWGDPNRCAAAVARRKGIPHLLAPCGMLEKNALRRSYWKKFLAKMWFQDRSLRDASCLLAKSEKELHDIRGYGLKNPVAVIPNPILTPEFGNKQCPLSEETLRFINSRERTAVFLGRIHPVKGIMRLAEAWVNLARYHDSWNLVVAGANEGGYRDVVEQIITTSGCAASVHFTGVLDDNEKWALLHRADLFVVPSDFENFGNSVVEAMIAGLPIITTSRSPWKELYHQGVGWSVEPDTGSLISALESALGNDGEVLQEMGRRGKALCAAYTPETVGRQCVDVYQWLLGRGDTPVCVNIELRR